MKISKLALIALLGGALAAFGCGSSSSGGGGGGAGGSAGGGGAGGEGGAGGGGMEANCPALDGQQTATYEFTCDATIAGATIPVTTNVTLLAANGDTEFATGADGALTTCAEYEVLGIDIGALMVPLTAASATVGWTNADPASAEHTIPGLPIQAENTGRFDEVTTDVTVTGEAGMAVVVTPSALALTVETSLGPLDLSPGMPPCGPLELLLGEEEISFPIIDGP